MHAYTETNLQRYNQVSRSDFSAASLGAMQASCELAVPLFCRRFRANGKRFLAHLVGTASMLLEQQASAVLVAAGLLDAAYAQGDFGDGQRGMTPGKLACLREKVGDVIASLVALYTAFCWKGKFPREILENIDSLSPTGRQIVQMGLANEREDHLDLGMRYCRKLEKKWELSTGCDPSGTTMLDIAMRLGYASVADELEQHFTETANAEASGVLQCCARSSFTPGDPVLVSAGPA